MATSNNKLLEENLQATKDLTAQVKDLSGRLSAKEILHRRTRRLGIVAVLISLISVLGLSFSGYVIWENAKNAKINCLNANESRQFQLDLWTYIIESEENDKDNTLKEAEMIDRLPPYLKAAWRQRDCDDLSKRYEIPRPPTVVK